MSLDLAPPSGAASLDLVSIADLSGRFFVPKYQRGYRWRVAEVRALLNDIWENTEPVYCLQPVVVKQREGEWELVDGQQRLTTLYLVFLYMERERLQNAAPPYTMRYETRPRSEAFLRDLNGDPGENVDFFHIDAAYRAIAEWFEAHGAKRQYAANKVDTYLHERVKVIWYEAAPELDAIELFTRLNVGRIPLTNAELVKALLLAQGRPGAAERPVELAAQWDLIERDLRDPDLWAFTTNASTAQYPSRIELLLELLAGTPRGSERVSFHVFDALRERLERSREAFWREVLALHATIREWYEDRDLHHHVGFLVAEGEPLAALVAVARTMPRSELKKELARRIGARVNLTSEQAEALDFEHHAAACARLLLLMNVETVRRLQHTNERYPFRPHKEQRWSLEHIHAQHAQRLNKSEQWVAWLAEHRAALGVLPGQAALASRLDAALAKPDVLNRAAFDKLADEVTQAFTVSDGTAGAGDSLHSIANLALLPGAANSALNNAVFEVKRQRILALDRDGAFIPPCTRRVFLKYYADADAQQVHFWGPRDRAAWLAAMFDPAEGLLVPYLNPAVSP
jgi:hypothetical protein